MATSEDIARLPFAVVKLAYVLDRVAPATYERVRAALGLRSSSRTRALVRQAEQLELVTVQRPPPGAGAKALVRLTDRGREVVLLTRKPHGP